MLSFAYTIDLSLKDSITRIDQTRRHILSLPLPVHSEQKLAWEGNAIRTWATLALAGHDLPRAHIAALLSHPTKPTRSVSTIYRLRECYQFIHTSWRGNAKAVSVAALETLFTTLSPDKTNVFREHESDVKELLAYVGTGTEHPVIQAALAHRHVLRTFADGDAGVFARMAHYLFLAKYGYDVRGWATPDRVWTATGKSYARLIAQNDSLNPWLSYIIQSELTDLTNLLANIQTGTFHVEYPQRFWELSQRQKAILTSLEDPHAKITNRDVKRSFKISQITASRDLARLTTLGLLYPHGKGRSVYYTKI